MKNIEPILIPIKKLITDKDLRVLFYESYVDGGSKHDFDFLNQFAPTRCPHCGKENYSFIGKDKNGLFKYKCNECEKEFTLLTKTAFEGMPRPLHSFRHFLNDLFDKKFNEGKAITNDEEYRTSVMFSNLSKILYRANSVNKEFQSDEVQIHIFSFPDEVRDLEQLRSSEDLHNLIIAVLTDGLKVKVRVVGTGYVNKRFLYNRISKLLKPETTLVHAETFMYDSLVFHKNLKEKIILGNAEDVKNSKELKEAIKLETEFKNFLNYYDTPNTRLLTDIFIATFELVERKNCTKEDKIAFVISLLLNSYVVGRKELFYCHSQRFDQEMDSLTF